MKDNGKQEQGNNSHINNKTICMQGLTNGTVGTKLNISTKPWKQHNNTNGKAKNNRIQY